MNYPDEEKERDKLLNSLQQLWINVRKTYLEGRITLLMNEWVEFCAHDEDFNPSEDIVAKLRKLSNYIKLAMKDEMELHDAVVMQEGVPEEDVDSDAETDMGNDHSRLVEEVN